ncbi:MAG: metalloregulator ArsR/SmtB family transcription factor [Nanoarchaeota archaeon]|nr:metalloregulator ArsR/SmtB family transcription factor [Nanoarchaeota archaeon]MBU1854996.1 metalloregulator ArsR/SmtB family transcription factor [Nanoarchaeota archaeon]
MKSTSYHNFFLNFANTTRFAIIMSLIDKPLNVTEISEKIGEEQSKTSHNLKKLEHCHIIEMKKKGKQRIYSLNAETVIPVLNLIEKHIKNHCKKCDKHEI